MCKKSKLSNQPSANHLKIKPFRDVPSPRCPASAPPWPRCPAPRCPRGPPERPGIQGLEVEGRWIHWDECVETNTDKYGIVIYDIYIYIYIYVCTYDMFMYIYILYMYIHVCMMYISSYLLHLIYDERYIYMQWLWFMSLYWGCGQETWRSHSSPSRFNDIPSQNYWPIANHYWSMGVCVQHLRYCITMFQYHIRRSWFAALISHGLEQFIVSETPNQKCVLNIVK